MLNVPVFPGTLTGSQREVEQHEFESAFLRKWTLQTVAYIAESQCWPYGLYFDASGTAVSLFTTVSPQMHQ